MSQSGFKTNGDIIRKVIIYSKCKLNVYLYSYCVIYEIIIVILLFIILFFTSNNYNNRDEVTKNQSGFKTNGDIIRKVIIYSKCNLDVYLYSYCDIYEIIIVILLFIILFFTVIIMIEIMKR
jgi:uncharacterized membrane protein YvbJ